MSYLEKYCSSQVHIEQRPEYQSWRRVHGLQLPLHVLQLAGWLLLAFFIITTFLVLIPALGPSIRPLVLFLIGSLFFLHIVSHVVALTIDPADYELRMREKAGLKTRPGFDRSKHLHVIENGICHICNIRASGPQTKHCRLCNKCVERFDHHCKWLNQCIGARNYVAFLVCIVSAMLGTITVFSVSLSEIFLYFVDPQWLDSLLRTKIFTSTFTNSNYIVSQLPLSKNYFLATIIAQTVLSVVAFSLLLHLCLFHVYISVLGLTTYEYIRKTRLSQTLSSANVSFHNSASGSTSTSSIPFHVKSYSYGSQDKFTFNGKSMEASDLNLVNKERQDRNACCRILLCYSCQYDTSDTISSRVRPLPRNAISESELNGVRKTPIENHHRSLDSIEYVYEKTKLKETCSYCQERRLSKSSCTLGKMKKTRRRGFFASCCDSDRDIESKLTRNGTEKILCRRNQINPSSSTIVSHNRSKIFTTPRRSNSLNSLPALPPAARRQVQSVSLKELNEILAYVQRPQSANASLRRPINSFRRQLRRKSNPQLKPTKTPNLSPIHESGLSNPSTPHLRDRGLRPKEGLWVSPLTLTPKY